MEKHIEALALEIDKLPRLERATGLAALGRIMHLLRLENCASNTERRKNITKPLARYYQVD